MKRKEIIRVCFEYQLINSDTLFISDCIEFKKYQEFNEKLLKIAANWYMKDDVDITLYKGISIGKSIDFDFRASNVTELQVLFVLFSNDNLSKEIKFIISDNYVIKDTLVFLLKLLGVNYSFFKSDLKAISIVNSYNIFYKDSIFKKTLRNNITWSNNFFKRNKKEKSFFQGYSSTQKLISYFNNAIVSDQLFVSINHIMSSNKTLYFNPTIVNNKSKNLVLNNLEENNFKNNNIEEILEIMLTRYYNKLVNKAIATIDNIVIKFKQLNIMNVILMCEIPLISSLISQIIHKRQGKVYLLNHGVRDFSIKAIMNNINQLDGIFCWSKYELDFFNKYNNRIKTIPCGYPIFLERKREKEKKLNISKSSKILILPDLNFEYWDTSIKKGLDDLLLLIKKLINVGYNRNNITVKIHPGTMNIDFFYYLLDGLLEEKNILKDGNINEIIDKNDLVIGPFSTVLYESIFLNTPYIVFGSYLELFTENIFYNLNIPIFNSKTIHELIKYLDNFDYIDFDKLKDKMLYKNNYKEVCSIIKNEFNKETK
ncbi:MAG: hypothetical protein HRT41_04050 [Campylobacteraceae bacterium]|nr:hypothetical protein [Campylobacteraceae bacterium]